MAAATSKNISTHKGWFTFATEIANILTFIMVAIIFFTGVAIAVRVAGTVGRVESIVQVVESSAKEIEDTIRNDVKKIIDEIKRIDVRRGLEKAEVQASRAVDAAESTTAARVTSREVLPAANATMPSRWGRTSRGFPSN